MDVDTPDQINAVFDTISYSKGSSVIRMMENFMGTEDFKAGIKKFLEDFSYKNAVTQDLFDALEAACDLEITEVFLNPLLQLYSIVIQQLCPSDYEHVDEAERIPRPHADQKRQYLHCYAGAISD